jgi:hypothetical protein
MTSTSYPTHESAAAAMAGEFPDAAAQSALSEATRDDVWFDAASRTVIELRDHPNDQPPSTEVTTFPGSGYSAELGLANIIADRIEATRRDTFDPALLAAALAELTVIATASIPDVRGRHGDEDADTAWELYNRYLEARDRFMVAEALLNRHTRLVFGRLSAEDTDTGTIRATVCANDVEEVIDRVYADQRTMRELPTL